MVDYYSSSKSSQIKVLLGVLGAGLLAGVLFALSTLYYYNPSGSYIAKNVLLTPQQAYALRFIEPGSKGRAEGKYAFEGIYFSYFDDIQKQQKTFPISQEQYESLYNLIANESSIVYAGDDVQSLFTQAPPATLTLKLQSIGEDLTKGGGVAFYAIDFANNNDYYRIQLRQSGPGMHWAYFYHPGIYQEILKLFHPKS